MWYVSGVYYTQKYKDIFACEKILSQLRSQTKWTILQTILHEKSF